MTPILTFPEERSSSRPVEDRNFRRYADRSGNSGVTAYRRGPDFIDLEFRDGKRYRYTHAVPGIQEVNEMKARAEDGKDLATFVNQHVRERYAARLR